jgi:hypothetical protein
LLFVLQLAAVAGCSIPLQLLLLLLLLKLAFDFLCALTRAFGFKVCCSNLPLRLESCTCRRQLCCVGLFSSS